MQVILLTLKSVTDLVKLFLEWTCSTPKFWPEILDNILAVELLNFLRKSLMRLTDGSLGFKILEILWIVVLLMHEDIVWRNC